MVGSKGAARDVYDAIRLQARNECPYCGGCGELISLDPSEVEADDEEEVGTLDHFLPKARFPAFSILPANLVPSCSVCNGGMSSKFPEKKSEQPLHPYFDAHHFFDEKWTTVSVSDSEPVLVTFDVSPPGHWSEEDKERVRSHFKGCKLRSRYRVRASMDITSLVEQRKTVHRNLAANDFREILSSVANNKNLPINGWKRTLHCGLAESVWFCEHKFI